MRVSVCQARSGPDKATNLEAALALLDQCGAQGAEVAVLPECVDVISSESEMLANAEKFGGPFSAAIAKKAKELGIWVVGGTIRVLQDNGRAKNMLIVYDPDGNRTAVYSKLHLFDLSIPGQVEFLESRTVQSGDEMVTTNIAGVQSGLSVCYDLRFPEIFRLHALSGAKILYIPSAFTTFTGRDHWEVLLRARAIENQCFVVAANQYGTPAPGMSLYGRSMIIDPWGVVLACAPDGAAVITADLDLQSVDAIRNKLPALQNRRADIYNLAIV